MAPQNDAYELLEGGQQRAPALRRRYIWKRFAFAAGALITLVWLFGPHRTSTPSTSPENTDGWHTQTAVFPVETHYTSTTPGHDVIALPPSATAPVEDENNVDGDDAPPTPSSTAQQTTPSGDSYDSDSDPLKTTRCTAPFSAASPLVQFALMIDAGSTGSRIHVYKFNNCGASPQYEYEVFSQTQPGLSSYAGRPQDAAASLDVLLNEAMRVVPDSLHHCTHVAVKATAGLRLLPGSQSSDILDAVRLHIAESYPFVLPESEGVVIMDGKDEGVYAWITANYLLDTIRADVPVDTPTYAVLDLGGGSTQIVFEPTFASQEMRLEDGEHKYELTFGGRSHVLYQHSYLGYGLKTARSHVHRLVDFMASLRVNPAAVVDSPPESVANPCVAQGMTVEVEVMEETTKVTKTVKMEGMEIGGFEACDRIVQLVIAKDSMCELKPCSFNGVYQPSLLDAFPTGKVLLLSYFYDRISPLLSSADTTPLTVATIATLARDVCAGRLRWLEVWGADPGVMAELEGRGEHCLDLTFMHGLLRLGYEFEEGRGLRIEKKVGGTELGWCLGAAIAMVGGELKCRD